MAKNSMFIDDKYPTSDLNYQPSESPLTGIQAGVNKFQDELSKINQREKELQTEIERKSILQSLENHYKQFEQSRKTTTDEVDTWNKSYNDGYQKWLNNTLKKYPNTASLIMPMITTKKNGYDIDVSGLVFTQRGQNYHKAIDQDYLSVKEKIDSADDPLDISDFFIEFRDLNTNSVFFDTLSPELQKKYTTGLQEYADAQYIYKQAEVINPDGTIDYVETANNLKNENFKIYNLSEIELNVSDKGRINAGDKLKTLANNNDELTKVAYKNRANQNIDKLIALQKEREAATDNKEIINIDAKIKEIEEQLSSNKISVEIYAAYIKTTKNKESNPIIHKDLTILANMGYLPDNFHIYAKFLKADDYSTLVTQNRTAKEKNQKGENKQILDMKATIINNAFLKKGIKGNNVTGNDLADGAKYFSNIGVNQTEGDRLMREEFLIKFSLLDDIIQTAKESGISVRALIQDGRVFKLIDSEYEAQDYRYGDTTDEVEYIRNALYGDEIVRAKAGMIEPDRPDLVGKVVINGIVQDQSYFNKEGKKITPTNYVATYQNYIDKTRKRRVKETLSNYKNRMFLERLRMDRMSKSKINEIKRILNVVED